MFSGYWTRRGSGMATSGDMRRCLGLGPLLIRSPSIARTPRYRNRRLLWQRAGLRRPPREQSVAPQCAAPEKSIGRRHSAPPTGLIGAGVLRLLPTTRGPPAVTTAPTAIMSPLVRAESASFFEPPTQASITTTSASQPARKKPEFNR